MIYLVIKRTAFDLWDNGFVSFAINLSLVGVILVALLLLELAATSQLALSVASLLFSMLLLLVLPLAGGLFARYAGGAEGLPLTRMVVAAVIGAPVLLWSLFFLLSQDGFRPQTTGGVFALVLGIWMGIIVAEFAVLMLVGLAQSGTPLHRILRCSCLMIFGHPVATLLLLVLGSLLALISLGLFPGFVGFVRLFQNAIRLVDEAYDGNRPDNLQRVLIEERRRLSARNGMNLIFPWRAN